MTVHSVFLLRKHVICNTYLHGITIMSQAFPKDWQCIGQKVFLLVCDATRLVK